MTGVLKALKRRSLMSVATTGALIVGLTGAEIGSVHAQTPPPQSGGSDPSTLPPVTIDAPQSQTRRRATTPAPAARPRTVTRTNRARQQTPSAPAPAPVSPPQTEATGLGTGYQAAGSGLSRLPTPLINTPQTINVVTQQVIREQNATTVADALRNVPGITFRAGEGGNQGDTPIIRGFDARNDIFRDGVRDPGWYTRDVFSVENVEVLKGPSSFLFGRGSTGGVINLVSKAPKEQTFVEADVIGNTGPGIRATLDANGKINEAVTARLQVMGQRHDIPDRDNVEENRWGIAPSLSLKMTEDTKATFSYIFQHDSSIPDRGIPFLPLTFGLPRASAPVPKNTWYGILSGADPDKEVIDAHIATAKIEHNFTNDIKLTNTTRYVNVDRLNRATLPQGFNPTPDNLASYTFRTGRQNQNFTNELAANTTDLSARFWTGPLEHQFVAGADFYNEKREQISRPYLNATAGFANAFAPDPFRNPGLFGPPGLPTTSEATTAAAYVADQIKIGEILELLGGVRYDNFETTSGSAILMQNRETGFGVIVSARCFIPSRIQVFT